MRTVGSEESNAEGSEWEEEQQEVQQEEEGREKGRVVWGLPERRMLCANFPRFLNKSSYRNSVTDNV